jgi:hypothetical protein
MVLVREYPKVRGMQDCSQLDQAFGSCRENSATAESSKAKASFVGYKREAEGPDKSISANTRRLKSREILLRTPEKSPAARSASY